MHRLLVTGGAGFIGSNYVRRLLGRSAPTDDDLQLVVLDDLTYAGSMETLAVVADDPRFEFIRGDVADPSAVASAVEGCTHIVHFAAESHVDRSISSPSPFVRTNVVGTQVLLDAARRVGIERFVHISTDEVYGSLAEDEPSWTEGQPLEPRSPYSASKAAADLLVQAYHHTYGLPTIVTRSVNNYGPYQYPEKVMPLFVSRLLAGRRVPLYGDGRHRRSWIHVDDHCRAIESIRQAGRPGEIYHVAGRQELMNLDLVSALARACGRMEPIDSLIETVPDRPGHDRRYALDGSKLADELGFVPEIDLSSSLGDLVAWYRDNAAWWQPRLASFSFSS